MPRNRRVRQAQARQRPRGHPIRRAGPATRTGPTRVGDRPPLPHVSRRHRFVLCRALTLSASSRSSSGRDLRQAACRGPAPSRSQRVPSRTVPRRTVAHRTHAINTRSNGQATTRGRGRGPAGHGGRLGHRRPGGGGGRGARQGGAGPPRPPASPGRGRGDGDRPAGGGARGHRRADPGHDRPGVPRRRATPPRLRGPAGPPQRADRRALPPGVHRVALVPGGPGRAGARVADVTRGSNRRGGGHRAHLRPGRSPRCCRSGVPRRGRGALPPPGAGGRPRSARRGGPPGAADGRHDRDARRP